MHSIKENRQLKELIGFIKSEYSLLEGHGFNKLDIYDKPWKVILVWTGQHCLVKMHVDTRDFFSVINFIPISPDHEILVNERILPGLLLHEAIEVVGNNKVEAIYKKYGMTSQHRKKDRVKDDLTYDNIKRYVLRDKEIIELSIKNIIRKYKLGKYKKEKAPVRLDKQMIEEKQKKASLLGALDRANIALHKESYDEAIQLLLPYEDILTPAGRKLIAYARSKLTIKE